MKPPPLGVTEGQWVGTPPPSRAAITDAAFGGYGLHCRRMTTINNFVEWVYFELNNADGNVRLLYNQAELFR